MNYSKTIKSIENLKYMISLVEASNDLYYVSFENKVTGKFHQSEGIKDLGIASYYFDIKLRDFNYENN